MGDFITILYLVSYAPVDHLFGGLATDGANISQIFLSKGHATGGHASLFLHLQLALQFAAPHSLDEAAVLLLKLLCLFQRMCSVDMLIKIFLCFFVQAALNIFEHFGDADRYLAESDLYFFTVIAADSYAAAGASLFPD